MNEKNRNEMLKNSSARCFQSNRLSRIWLPSVVLFHFFSIFTSLFSCLLAHNSSKNEIILNFFQLISVVWCIKMSFFAHDATFSTSKKNPLKYNPSSSPSSSSCFNLNLMINFLAHTHSGCGKKKFQISVQNVLIKVKFSFYRWHWMGRQLRRKFRTRKCTRVEVLGGRKVS